MLLVRNLLADYTEVLALLRGQFDAARDGDPDEVLDAFLLAAGANQIVEDHLHRDVLALGKVSSLLPSGPAAAANALRAAGTAIRSAVPRERSLRRHQRRLAALTEQLADVVADASGRPGALDLPAVKPVPAELARSIVRLPNCFRSFDQHPEDCRRLAELYSGRGGDPDRPLLLLGLRTSGSYLAPLTASFLRAIGHRSVETMTCRPGRPWLPGERRRLRSFARRDGAVLLIDDPPRSGVQLSRAARELRKLGVPASSIVLLVPLLGPELPEPLQSLDVVQLPWKRWSVQERLEGPAVSEALAALRGRRVSHVERLELHTREAAAERSHASALFSVDGAEHLFVRGVGLGYLGRHALAMGEALGEFLPHIHGFRDGLLYREWLPEEERLQPKQAVEPRVARELAAYAAARVERLPVAEDASVRLLGRDALWEHVAGLLGRAFGKLRLPLRPALHRTARRLLHVPAPAVPDGSMHLRSWFDGVALHKVQFEERSFAASGLTLYNFDPVFDLATAATEAEAGEGLAPLLLAEYEARAGTQVSHERWLLYLLLRLYNTYRAARREGGDDVAPRLLALEQAMAHAHRGYMSELFFGDVGPPTAGPLCAIDIDGVLETRWLPYPAIGPAGALAIRALILHGFRPVLVTGRSLDDVIERCAAYRIPAGVAEYGAIFHDRAAGDSVSLLSDQGHVDLERLRATLLDTPGVYVDPGYRNGVRAYNAEGDGGLEPVLARRAMDEAGVTGRVHAIAGELQTDFIAVGVDKGTGLAALRRHLAADVALAVGDSAADLPMLAVAARKFAPANAAKSVRDTHGIRITRAPYQAGLAAAVESLLGHRPGGCERCRPPRLSTDAQLLMHVLAAQDGSRWSKLRHGLALARLTRGAA